MDWLIIQNIVASRVVAVGTRISPHAPHRSRRALLTHRAPPLGFCVKAASRKRTEYPDWRKETFVYAVVPVPGHAGSLETPS